MTGSLRVIQDESKNVQNGTLFMLGYEKYLADVTVSGDKATVTGKHYTSKTPKGEDVKDVTLTIADSDLKADAKNMILFVKDGEIDVAEYIEKTGKGLGGTIKVADFVRYEKGEGIEKREDDFAAEVASMVK